MIHAYSRLKHLLHSRQLSVPELHRRLGRQGFHVNLKSLYRLGNEELPLERLDLRVAGAICKVCEVPLSELIAFETGRTRLRRLSAGKQRRLDALMGRNNEGQLTGAERNELEALVREAEEITLANAKALARERRRLVGG
jgi:hypothetical protein